MSTGADTILVNQSPSGDQTVISAGRENFVLGFFKPGNNSSNYYLGMWYKQARQAILWVANREKQVSDRFSSELRISHDNLVLFNGSKLPIWSTNLNSSSSPSIEAVLLDNGNLVLRVGYNFPNPTLGQSFDHLTNAWLPGSKVGYNKKTRHKNVITSWKKKNSEDPSSGLFSLEPVPSDNPFLILWNKSRIYWSSGAWDESARSFSLISEMGRSAYFNFTFVSNDDKIYLTYSMKQPKKKNIYSVNNIADGSMRYVMDVSGQLKELILNPNTKKWDMFWSQPREQCQVYAFCMLFVGNMEAAMRSPQSPAVV